jgi:hypothetical protein
MDAKRIPVQPGSTFIAYIDDYTSCVGVLIGQDEEDERKWKTLVLGYMYRTQQISEHNVFEKPFQYDFPGYMPIMKDGVFPYDFKPEIALCKMRNSVWWKSFKPPCYTNLVAKHFRPKHIQELQYIDMAIQILNGMRIKHFETFGYWDEEIFLRMWAVLYSHFPTRVATPPREYDAKRSNIYYKIDLECVPPNVTFGCRPPGYKKNKK